MSKEKPMETFGVTFTPEKLERFKAALKKHQTEDEFTFEDKLWDTRYATYLAQYLEGVFFTGRQEYKR
jgi:hypothetical protein